LLNYLVGISIALSGNIIRFEHGRCWRSFIPRYSYAAGQRPFGRETVQVIAYVRTSTARQQEAFGPDVQRAAIRQFAKRAGHRVVAWETDTISGTSELASREGWREAAALVRAGKAKGIVVARIDRLARDVMVQELLLRNLTELGGVVLSARDSENELLTGESKDPSRKLIRTILGAISEYDREMITDRLSAARKAKAARGGYAHGALPYGYRSQGGKLVPLPAEQKALCTMRSLSAQGLSTHEIADILATEGYPTKRGGKWCGATVARILKRHNTAQASA
jgi:DNA invertase Pin-like site-specific DNA recombinase